MYTSTVGYYLYSREGDVHMCRNQLIFMCGSQVVSKVFGVQFFENGIFAKPESIDVLIEVL